MTLPQQLLDRWRALVPALAEKVASSLNASLHQGAPLPAAGKGAPSPEGAPPQLPQGTAVPPAAAPAPGLSVSPAASPAPLVLTSTETVPASPVAVSTETAPGTP